MRFRTLIYAAAAPLLAGAMLATTAGGALARTDPMEPPRGGASTSQGGMAATVSYEVDNGSAWKLDAKPTSMSGTYNGYADAGIVYDLGPAKDFTGITFTGTGTLVANVWLGDGSQAYTPGEHPFATDPVNFSYGPFGQVFWTGPQAGQPATVDHIKTLGDTEVYAWVGISGAAPQVGHVDAIPGMHNAVNLSLTTDGTTVTASAR